MDNIKQLRQAGKLDEALAAAQAALQANPDNTWAATNLAWVHDAFCKKYAEGKDANAFKKHLLAIVHLNILPNNPTLANTLCWRLRSLISNKKQGLTQTQTAQLADFCFALAKKLNPEKPADHYSALLHAFLSLRNAWNGIPQLMEWWGWGNFRPEDFQPKTLPSGMRMPISLAEQCYIACAKSLLKTQDTQAILSFIPQLKEASNAHPDFTFTSYYAGKLIMASCSDPAEAVATLVPFVRKKQKEFWAWQLLSEAFPPTDQRHLACLLRAASCPAPEEFLVRVRFGAAKALIGRADYAQAKRHLRKYLTIKEKEHAPLPKEVAQWASQSWFSSDVADANPPIDHMAITQDILLADTPEAFAVIYHVNAGKNIANAITGPQKSIFFLYDKLLKDRPAVGSCILYRADRQEADGFVKLLSLRTANPRWNNFHKQVVGVITTNKKGTTHFIRTPKGIFAFIPPKLFSNSGLNVGDKATAVILLTPQPAKDNVWSWTAVSIAPLAS